MLWKEAGPEHFEVYPVTIFQDRYRGSYSGATWYAIEARPWKLEPFMGLIDNINEGDGDVWNFWHSDEPKKFIFGRGNSPDQAYEDLKMILFKQECEHPTEDVDIGEMFGQITVGRCKLPNKY